MEDPAEGEGRGCPSPTSSVPRAPVGRSVRGGGWRGGTRPRRTGCCPSVRWTRVTVTLLVIPLRGDRPTGRSRAGDRTSCSWASSTRPGAAPGNGGSGTPGVYQGQAVEPDPTRVHAPVGCVRYGCRPARGREGLGWGGRCRGLPAHERAPVAGVSALHDRTRGVPRCAVSARRAERCTARRRATRIDLCRCRRLVPARRRAGLRRQPV